MARLRFCRALLIIFISFSLESISITCTQFEVGGKDGWTLPHSKNDDAFNQWASGNRFQVNDTIHFKYKDDSIMEVSNGEYSECRSTHPISYANNGDTVINLDRPGFFYFISGISAHCNGGMKMIIKVLEQHHPSTTTPPPSQSQDSTASSSAAAIIIIPTFVIAILMVFFSGVVLI